MTNPVDKMHTLEAGTYDTQGVAELLNVSERHIRDMVKDNQIPGVIRFGRLIRFHKGIVNEWLVSRVAEVARG